MKELIIKIGSIALIISLNIRFLAMEAYSSNTVQPDNNSKTRMVSRLRTLNRAITDVISSLLKCSARNKKKNLLYFQTLLLFVKVIIAGSITDKEQIVAIAIIVFKIQLVGISYQTYEFKLFLLPHIVGHGIPPSKMYPSVISFSLEVAPTNTKLYLPVLSSNPK